MQGARLDAHTIRRIVLERSFHAKVGHIGSALCVADILAVLYGGYLRIASPRDPDRDRFLMSKGHAALALYAALHLRGWLTSQELESYCGDGSPLGTHPEHVVPGIDFSTGSLGQGLSYGTGAALAARLQESPRRVVVLLSDAECNEGAVWEAAMFAAHHRLANLVGVLDLNGQQALGSTKAILDLGDMPHRWRAFGWSVHEVDGHDPAALAQALGACSGGDKPHLVVARTVFGKGVSFMERQLKWHYWPMSEVEYRLALSELGDAP